MKRKMIEQQAIPGSRSATPQDIASFYAESHCPHIERWLPHILETNTLPTGKNDYMLENPIHDLHLRAGVSRTGILFGDEQKRSDSIWKTSGIVDLYLPNRLPPENQHYYSKKEVLKGKKALPASEAVKPNSTSSSGTLVDKAMAKPVEIAPATGVKKMDATSSNHSTINEKHDLTSSNTTANVGGNSSTVFQGPTKHNDLKGRPSLSSPESQLEAIDQLGSVPDCTTSVASTAPAASGVKNDPVPPVYEISEERFQQLRRAENQILLQRRNLFFKRESKRSKYSAASSKKSKKREASFSTKSSVDQYHPFILDRDAWEKEAHRARDKVETWLQYFRSCRSEFWRTQQNKDLPKAFGAIEELSTSVICQQCSPKEMNNTLMQCLDCGYIACAPRSLAPDSKQHMILHMLTTNHKLAATFGPRSLIYCFGCGDVVCHPVFEGEQERIELEHTLPEWSWPAHAIQRSFDAFQFVTSKDHGMIWKGLVATYPTKVPKHHLQAARMVLKRFKLYDQPVISTPVGLYNLGNTCFMNGILQCLIHCPPVQKHFLQQVRHDYRACRLFRGKGECLACEFDHLLVKYYGSSIGENVAGVLNGKSPVKALDRGLALVPSSLLVEAWKQPEMDHLKGYEQRDAHEFLQAFLDVVAKHAKVYEATIQRNLAAASKPPRDPVDIVKHLFEGTLRSVSVCEDCGCKRSLDEPFINVSLPLSEDSVLKYTARKMNIQHCLHQFTAPERLCDPIECPSCQKKTPTKKQQTFSRLPKILCLHLKRFDAAKNKKITDFVSFPSHKLDMGPLMPHWREVTLCPDDKGDETVVYPEVLYDLFGTVNHCGTLNQGHYVSHVKVGEQWYYCNDAHISTSEESEVMKSEGAYVLFYIRR